MKLASEAPFPYGYPGRVCYFEQLPNGELQQARTRDDIRQAVTRACAGTSFIYAAWPGEYRTDLFRIDDLDQLAAAVGVKDTAPAP